VVLQFVLCSPNNLKEIEVAERMKDAYELLRDKERELGRVRQEVEALRAVIPMLTDAAGWGEGPDPGVEPRNKWPLRLGERPQAPGSS
jgi:hypothetical protein